MQSEPAFEPIIRLFRDGNSLESIMSGWRLTESRIADLLIAAHRGGERIDPRWLLPKSLQDRVLEVVRTREDLSAVDISTQFKGKVSPPIVRALKAIAGTGGLETRILNEETFAEKLHDDLAGAKREILVVSPDLKGRHWRRSLDAYRHVIIQEGTVAFFCGRVSDLLLEEVKDQGIILIENQTNANLVLIDGRILWEGSMNFLIPPRGGEHVRRTESLLACEEVRDLHDLYL